MISTKPTIYVKRKSEQGFIASINISSKHKVFYIRRFDIPKRLAKIITWKPHLPSKNLLIGLRMHSVWHLNVIVPLPKIIYIDLVTTLLCTNTDIFPSKLHPCALEWVPTFSSPRMVSIIQERK